VEAASADIVDLRSEFGKMLGGAIGVERFERAVLTAIQRDPDLLSYPRDSLVSTGLKAAQDRLLPDGREGAFVVRWNAKARRKEVTWAPMVFGIVKVAKQYGGVRSLSCEIVYQGEPFRILMGDEMRIEHERIPARVVQGKEIGCCAIFCLADGDRIREFMTAAEIRQVEESSESAKKGVAPRATPSSGTAPGTFAGSTA
jgi:recombination protein RecT